MEDTWKDREYAKHYNDLYATPATEFVKCAGRLRVAPGDRVIDFGCGKGDFLAAALQAGASATGVDMADEQLELAAQRFRGDARVELVKASFLDFSPGPRTFTRGFSRKALHHLTDEEKAVFFSKAGKYFKPKALFLLEDGIFDFERTGLDANWDRLMQDCAVFYGAAWDTKKKDVTFCFRQEYPTGIKAWTAALAAGGFRVLDLERRSSFYGSLLAEKE
ncbi:MAG: hypothetical protein A2234_07875 [Elusimicrobia bacterium RIFOXYA2_FULL_58_8]|nr:MAG: hypothetical protein A2234_07875 [Elusimicrobia bacterium RIFOXYA2_FULL_58_8]OGS13921.1 MAG: hypothetical protein A2285_10185 [Elusimicrobia bacterium RIFOXYA12_FULL_57_11]